VNIRPMRRQDMALVMEIAAASPRAPHWPQTVYAAMLTPDAVPARIALVADDPLTGVLGFLVAVLIPPHAELESIAVVAPTQRQGIGALLLAELLAVLKKKQITEVMLEVRESNSAARAFYASAGFVETGSRTGYYSDPKEDAILLRRSTM